MTLINKNKGLQTLKIISNILTETYDQVLNIEGDLTPTDLALLNMPLYLQ